MELSSFHRVEPFDAADVGAALREVCGPEWLHPRDRLSVAMIGPWRPCDLWRAGPERLVWSAALVPAGGLRLSEAGRSRLWSGSVERRHAPADPAEILGARLGSGLAVEVSDSAGLAYVALYRARELSSSRMLREREELVHCDGRRVAVFTPPDLPLDDRTDVVVGGFEKLLAEGLELDEDERLVFLDVLGELFDAAPPVPLIADGRWVGERVRRGA